MNDVKRFRLAVVTSHPVQYQAPLFKKLSKHPQIDLCVYYGSDSSIQGKMDPGFGIPIVWDRPLLEGYRYRFLKKMSSSGKSRHLQGMGVAFLLPEFLRERYDAVFVHSYATAASLKAYLSAWFSGTPGLLHT